MCQLRYILLLFAVLLMATCTKDKTVQVCQPCISFNESNIVTDTTGVFFSPGQTSIGNWYGYNLIRRDTEEHAPVFNPNNANEIAYIMEKVSSNYEAQIIVQNLLTKQQKIIYTGSVVSDYLSWGKNGWLVFSGTDLQLYKVKSSGDSLMKLTNEGGNYSATWNNAGNTIFFKSTKGGYPYFYSMNNDGSNVVAIDTSLSGIFSVVSPDGGKVVYKTGVSVYTIYNFETKQKFVIPVGDGINGAGWTIQWFPNSKHLIVTEGGNQRMLLVNGETGSLKLYYKGGRNKGYLNMSVSPDCKTIALERVDRTRLSNVDAYEETYISIMNIDGTNERRLN